MKEGRMGYIVHELGKLVRDYGGRRVHIQLSHRQKVNDDSGIYESIE